MWRNIPYKAWTNIALRAISAVLVTYFFLAALLVSTAQQEIVERLKAEDIGYDYTAAIRYHAGPHNLQSQVEENRRQAAAVRDQIQAMQLAQNRLQQRIEQSALALAQGQAQMGAAPGCMIPIVPAGQMDAVVMRNVANAALSCTIDPTADNAALAAGLARLKDAATRFNAAADEMEASNRELNTAQEHRNGLEQSRVALAGRVENATRSQPIVAMLEIFNGWPLAAQLVFVTPSLMPIILAFASGLFGALLITLVLSVYPANRFKFTKSNSYSGRLLLGGLIALGVVVLLFSGVAVLGGEGGTPESQNMMAYAAIGLLAGMFSDQAADWLSRTSRFAATGPGDENQEGQPAPAAPKERTPPPASRRRARS
jgi:hypothetical protein